MYEWRKGFKPDVYSLMVKYLWDWVILDAWAYEERKGMKERKERRGKEGSG